MLAIYPPMRTTLWSILWWFGGAQFLLSLIGSIERVLFIATGLVFQPLYQFIVTGGGGLLTLIFAIAMIAAIVDAIANARGEDAAPVRWLGGMWLIATVFSAVPAVDLLAGGPTLRSHYGDFVQAAYVLFIAFGVAYPVLRHRLGDLNILVSRATVFTVASTIVVGLFIAAEWGICKLFDESFGLSHSSSGLAAQFLTLPLVLALGMSARSIHGFVEERLTKAFFRKRMQGLAEIERLAGEADVATDSDALMRLGVQTVRHALNPLGVAYYLRRGDRYERGADTDVDDRVFPTAYAFNEAVPLRLRRWQEAFELDDDSEEQLHMLFVTMRVRGDLVGFLCCGPKPDRTTYLEDEVNALSLLAHHTAIASALLPRPGPSAHQTLQPAHT